MMGNNLHQLCLGLHRIRVRSIEHRRMFMCLNDDLDVALPPDMFQKLAIGLAQSIGKAAEQGNHAAIVTSARRRRFVHDIMAARGLPNPVIAYEEIGPATTPAILGSVAA